MNPDLQPQTPFPPNAKSQAPNAAPETSTQKQSTNCTNSANSSISEIREISGPAPKISVIVPVYKVEKYLPECIESVLAQTFTDFELILVDDGSPDNSGAICDAYAARDPRIRVFHKENGGVSSARNLGLDHARGEWIAFVDSDDTVGEKYLEHLWGEGPAAGTLIFSGFTYLDEKGRETRRLQFAAGTRPVREAFREEQLYRYGHPFSKLYTKELIEKHSIRFDKDLSMGEDLIFIADYLRNASTIVFRGDYLDYNYWIRQGSLSSRYSSFKKEFKLFVYGREMFKNLGITELSSQERRLLKWYFFRASSCLYRHPSSYNQKMRIAVLEKAFSTLLGWEFSEDECSRIERLLQRRHFQVFDFHQKILFQLRYGIFASLWETYRSLKNTIRYYRYRKNINRN